MSDYVAPKEYLYKVRGGYNNNDPDISITCLDMKIDVAGTLIFYGANERILHAFAKDKWNTVRREG